MQKKYLFFFLSILFSTLLFAQQTAKNLIGNFSLGTRNTISAFNDDAAIGLGIGGQFRIQLGQKLNSEWYLDYITSETDVTKRNDYHIGWSLMFYSKNNNSFNKTLQPYLLVGHCFDYSKVFEKNNVTNAANRLSMATQAGIGTHINFSDKFDCSISSQYMLHFGKEISTTSQGSKVFVTKNDYSSVEGHLLFSISFNYKLGKLWNKS